MLKKTIVVLLAILSTPYYTLASNKCTDSALQVWIEHTKSNQLANKSSVEYYFTKVPLDKYNSYSTEYLYDPSLDVYRDVFHFNLVQTFSPKVYKKYKEKFPVYIDYCDNRLQSNSYGSCFSNFYEELRTQTIIAGSNRGECFDTIVIRKSKSHRVDFIKKFLDPEVKYNFSVGENHYIKSQAIYLMKRQNNTERYAEKVYYSYYSLRKI